MKRQSTRRRETNTGERCREYAMQAATRCEVFRYLAKDKDVSQHLPVNEYCGHFEIHHIHRRPLPVERDWFSNLIHVSAAAHRWLTDHKYEGELACWYAKHEMHVKQLMLNAAHNRELPEDVSQHHWHVRTLDRICTGYAGFEGRLHYLLAQDVGPVFRGYGEELLKVLEG